MWVRRQSNRKSAIITLSFLTTKNAFQKVWRLTQLLASLKRSSKQVLGSEYFKDLPKKEKPQHHCMTTGLYRALGEARLLSTLSLPVLPRGGEPGMGSTAFPLAHAPQEAGEQCWAPPRFALPGIKTKPTSQRLQVWFYTRSSSFLCFCFISALNSLWLPGSALISSVLCSCVFLPVSAFP